MSREGADEKGGRYLLEGRLVVLFAGPGFVDAICRGSGAVYRLGYRRGGWWCTCRALRGCSHLVALQRVSSPLGVPNLQPARPEP